VQGDRNRMTKSPLVLWRQPREILYDRYYTPKNKVIDVSTQMAPKFVEDPPADVTARVFVEPDQKENRPITGELGLRYHMFGIPHNFIDFTISTEKGGKGRLLGCIFKEREYGALGSFLSLPLPFKQQPDQEINEYGVGARYSTQSSSIGIRVNPLFNNNIDGWLAHSRGLIKGGIGCSLEPETLKTLFNGAIYFTGSGLLSDKFQIGVEVNNNGREVIGSYYHHLVVRREVSTVKNPFENSHVVGIQNYLDLGAEVVDNKDEASGPNLRFGVSWQINRNLLSKAKLDRESVSSALVIKSWWDPSSTLSFNVGHNFVEKKTKFGLGFSLDNVGGPVFGMVRPNYSTTSASASRYRTVKAMEGELDTTQQWTEEDVKQSQKNLQKRDGKN